MNYEPSSDPPDSTIDSHIDRVAALFALALEAAPEARAELLRVAAVADDGIAAEVASLLDAADRAGGFLTFDQPEPNGGTVRSGLPGALQPGTAIDRYTLVRLLGEGGFGTVWLAEQVEPIRRHVALKLIKSGMDSRAVIRRFESERQALAVLDHPNIARVFDAGTTSWGRPYFVMEWVDGVPLREYCQGRQLSTSATLSLFVQVCQAIQHAHQKGVIHRDIKPSNVLVTVRAGAPAPKVIDFGVAQATELEQTTGTLLAELQQIVGTPAYMSPEQAQLSGADIDTRSDVYSLGVLLYELLTGTTPFAELDPRTVGLLEVLRHIREETPLRPSARAAAANPVASKLLRGELDWIVMRCLEKDRERRYASAEGLALDVTRYMNHEPVAAGPPRVGYRVGKFVRRNRRVVALATLSLLLLAGGAAGTTWGLFRALDEATRADREAGLAQAAARAASEAEGRALAARASAEQRAAELEQVVQFQAEQLARTDIESVGMALRTELTGQAAPVAGVDTEQVLAAVDFVETARRLWSKVVLQPALDTIDVLFAEQPKVQARLYQVSAKSLRTIGAIEASAAPQARALALHVQEHGAESESTLEVRRELALLQDARGDYAAAESNLTDTLAALRRTVGDEHRAIPAVLADLGWAQFRAGHTAEADRTLRDALAQYERRGAADGYDALQVVKKLGIVARSQGRLNDAEALVNRAVLGLTAVRGAGDRDTLVAQDFLATIYLAQGRVDDAERLYALALAGLREALGESHPLTLTTLGNQGRALARLRRFEEAEEALVTVQRERSRLLGREHPQTIGSVAALAQFRSSRGELALAEQLFHEAIERGRTALGSDHPTVLDWLGSLGVLHWQTKRFSDAVAIFREVLAASERSLGRDAPQTRLAMANLGVNLRELGELDEAVRWLNAAYRGEGNAVDPRFASELLTAYTRAQRTQEALALRREFVAEARVSWPTGSLEVANKLADLGLALLQASEFSEAVLVLRENLLLREQLRPDALATLNARVVLGAALKGLGELAAAEPLLLAGYEGLVARAAELPAGAQARIDDALGWIVELYAARALAGEVSAQSERERWQAVRDGRAAQHPAAVR